MSRLHMVKSINKLIWPKCCKVVSLLSRMRTQKGFEALNTSLKDIENSKSVMRDVTVFLVGYFCQILPVIPRGTRANEV